MKEPATPDAARGRRIIIEINGSSVAVKVFDRLIDVDFDDLIITEAPRRNATQSHPQTKGTADENR